MPFEGRTRAFLVRYPMLGIHPHDDYEIRDTLSLGQLKINLFSFHYLVVSFSVIRDELSVLVSLVSATWLWEQCHPVCCPTSSTHILYQVILSPLLDTSSLLTPNNRLLIIPAFIIWQFPTMSTLL